MPIEQEEKISFASFSIENMEGTGNTQLLNDLLAPETSTASLDDIKNIEEEKQKEEIKKKALAKSKEKPKEIPKKESEESEEQEEENPLSDFLGGKEKPTEKKEEKEESEEESQVEENRFAALSKDLFNLNVFTKEEGEEDVEINTPEEFLERFNFEKRKGADEQIQNFIGRFGEDYQNAFQAIYVKGVDPKEYFTTYNNIENIAEMDLTLEINQEAIVRKGLQDQGLDQAKITAKLEKIKSYGDLEDEAKTYHELLVKKEVNKLAQLEQESEQKLQIQTKTKQQYMQNVNNILQEKLKAKEFDGIPINVKLANELQDFLVTERWKTTSGETLTEFDKTILELKKPENHAQKVKVGLLLKMLQSDPKLTTLLKTAVTKQTEQIFSNSVKTKSEKTNKENKPERWFV